MNDYYLMHHGVIGMRWGVTRDKVSKRTLRSSRPTNGMSSSKINFKRTYLKGDNGVSSNRAYAIINMPAPKAKFNSSNKINTLDIKRLLPKDYSSTANAYREEISKRSEEKIKTENQNQDSISKTINPKKAVATALAIYSGARIVNKIISTIAESNKQKQKEMTPEEVAKQKEKVAAGREKAEKILKSVGQITVVAVSTAALAVAINKRMQHMDDNNYLEHHGVPGQRWGVRRYQNYDGTLKVAGKLKRSQALKAEASEYKKMAKTLKNPEDAIQKGKYEAKAAKLAAKAEKFKDQYEKKYAKAYVRDLNKARKEFNKAYDKSSNSIVNNIANGKGLSAETFLSGANLAATRFNYDQLKNKAISEIPSNTKYALELTSSGYKLRYKGEAAKVDGVTAKKVGEAVSGIKDVKDRKGIATVTSGGLKSAMDLYDVVKVNSSGKPSVSKTKTQGAISQNQNGQTSAPSNNTSKIDKGVKIASAFTNSASNIQKSAVSISNAIKAVKKASANKKEVSSIDNGTTTKGKSKLDSILATSGTILSFAVPAVSIASQIIQTKNAIKNNG